MIPIADLSINLPASRNRRHTSRILSILAAGLCILTSFQHAYAQGAPQQASEEEVEAAGKPGTTEINLKNAEIAAIIRIFSKKTGRNYILDENVKGKVTIYLPGKVSSGEAVRMLDSILALKGFTAVPVSENLWKIIPIKDAKQTTVPLVTAEAAEQARASAAVVTRIVPLKYVNVDDMKQLLSPLISPEGLINGYTGTNSLLIIDSEDNIQRVATIVSELDIPSSDRDMTIIPVQNADAVEIATKLNEILGTSSAGSRGQSSGGGAVAEDLLRNRAAMLEQVSRTNVAPQGGAQGRPAALDAGAFGGSKTVTARSREPKITADERTNSVIVVADEDTTTRIQALISQLDSKVDLSGNKFYVYRCQHASAQELVDVLAGLGAGGSRTSSTGALSGGSESGTSGRSSALGTSGSRTSTSQGSRSQDRIANQSRTPGRSRSEGNSRSSGGAANLGEDISITADPATNSLIIFASRSDYDRVMALLKELDVKRRQVLVEALLLEVGIDDTENLGFSFLNSTGGADGGMLFNNGSIINTLSNPSSIQNFAVAAASAGTLTLPNGVKVPTQSALLTAVKGNQNVNVLSAPTILTTDNEQAEIVVGQNVPFLASTSTSDTNLNNTFNQIDRQDVGITLRLTPQISSGDFVTLKIFTEVSNVVGDTAASTLGPTTTVRTSDTTVITKDSQMVVTGGLISDNIGENTSGIPYLKDVPVLGHLFKQSGSRHQKTNLLILITPRIIKDQFDHRDLTVEKRDDMEQQMAKLNSYPDRKEVLRDERINKVSEASSWDGPKPSTILPPLKESDGPQKLTLDAETGEQDGVVELRVAPKLPSAQSGTSAKSNTSAKSATKEVPASAPAPRFEPSVGTSARKEDAAPKGALSDTTQQPSAQLMQGQYVVLSLAKGQKAPASVPFLSAMRGSLLALSIGKDSPTAATRFFTPGQRYRFQAEGGDLIFTAQGIYGDEPSARSLHKGLASQWYALSPYEIMNLGANPWVVDGKIE